MCLIWAATAAAAATVRPGARGTRKHVLPWQVFNGPCCLPNANERAYLSPAGGHCHQCYSAVASIAAPHFGFPVTVVIMVVVTIIDGIWGSGFEFDVYFIPSH